MLGFCSCNSSNGSSQKKNNSDIFFVLFITGYKMSQLVNIFHTKCRISARLIGPADATVEELQFISFVVSLKLTGLTNYDVSSDVFYQIVRWTV